MFVTFFDTCMVSLAAIFVWRIKPYYIFFPWLTIACLDGVYLSSALNKVPDGAWFTLTLASVLAGVFILWRFGKEQQWAAEAADRFPTSHYLKQQDDGRLHLTKAYGGSAVSNIKGFGIFFDKAGATTPIVFSQFVTKLVAAPEVMVLFHIRPLETPSVEPELRYTVSRLSIPNCYRLIVRHGFNDVVISPDVAHLIYEQVRAFIIRSGHTRGPLNPITGTASGKDHEAGKEQEAKHRTVAAVKFPGADANHTPPQLANSESTTQGSDSQSGGDQTKKAVDEKKHSEEHILAELAKLDEAYEHQVLYIVGKEQLKISAKNNIFKKVLLHMFLWIRENTRTKIANLRVPTERVFEVGFVKDI